MADDIKTKLLDAAQLLVQTRGHNGYSYRDLAKQVGIRTASIHYHFPTKADLAVALVRRYREAFADCIAKIAIEKTTLADRLDSVAALFASNLTSNGRICVACALAGEYSTLPKEVKSELNRLIAESEGAIARFLTEGRTRGEIPKTANPSALARLWYSALQGALVMARASDASILAEVTAQLKQLTIKGK